MLNTIFRLHNRTRRQGRPLIIPGILACFIVLWACTPALPVKKHSIPALVITPLLEPTSTPLPSNMRQLAELYGWSVGAAFDPANLENPRYLALLESEFNGVVAENVMKWSRLEPERGRYDFSKADAIVEFAEKHKMAVRGHTLVWDLQLPDWLTRSIFSKDEYKAFLKEHITSVVGRYAGRIFAWDVVNEPLDERGQIRQNFWYHAIGPEYILLAFQWAHEADPEAELFLNESYAEGLGEKSQGVYALATGLLEKGAPIHGIGMQMHLRLENPPDPLEVTMNMRRLAELGLMIHITELDVRLQDASGTLDEKLVAQAQVYGDMAHACLSTSSCKAFYTWGLTDRYSWIPNLTGREDYTLLFDENWQPKPAYRAVVEALQEAILARQFEK